MTLSFDSVVICTGATSQVPQLRGLAKPNVFVLRTPADYLKLSSELPGIHTIVVSGPIPLSLRLSEVLASRGARVLVYCGKDGLASQFTEPFAGAIRRAVALRTGGTVISENGVVLVDDSVDSILGVQRAEAITSSGTVQTCDGVVIIPRNVPTFPAVGCEKGRGGGLVVDASMSTTLPDVYAAGDSAEIRFKSGSVPARLYSTGRVGGEVAGTNAARGRRMISAPSWAVEQTYFGLEFSSAGLNNQEAREMGLDAATQTAEYLEHPIHRNDPVRSTTVSIVYDRTTHEVYGAQVAGWRASSLSNVISMVVSLGLKVEQLVLLESPYSPGLTYQDSPIALTARKIVETEGT